MLCFSDIGFYNPQSKCNQRHRHFINEEREAESMKERGEEWEREKEWER